MKEREQAERERNRARRTEKGLKERRKERITERESDVKEIRGRKEIGKKQKREKG